MFESLRELFNSSEFMPHGHCYLWRPDILWLNVSSDAVIAFAYYMIPVFLVYLVRKRKDLAFNWMFVMFALFIVACGTTHLMNIVTVWNPQYGVDGLVKLFTAGASIATAVALLPLVPKILALPSVHDFAVSQLKLHKAYEKLRLMNVSLERRIAEKTRGLEQRNHDMEQFVYTVSHDLKTPLVTSTGFLGLLKEDLEAKRYHQIMDSVTRLERANSRMDQLINDLLQLSRIGQVRLEIEKVDVSKILEELRESLGEQFKEKSAFFKIHENLPSITGDHKRIYIAFENLVVNALKYACDGPDSIIEIGFDRTDHDVRFFVRDNGPGIAPEYHKKIFGLFQRLEADSRGTGVGLAIVSRIMQQHDGKVWVESSLGSGAVFWLAFPIKENV